MVWIGLRERGVVLLGGGRRINYLGVYFYFLPSFYKGLQVFCVRYLERKVFLAFLILMFFCPS